MKKAVSGNMVLYYLWFKFVRQRTGLSIGFFDQDTNVYIDGYPRSGNTFLIHLTKQLLSGLNSVHHLHKIAPIKIAIVKDLPVFILIRNPLDAISSNYLKHFAMRDKPVSKQLDLRLLNELILDYLFYYKFVSKHKDRITIIEFHRLINFPGTVINQIADKMDVQKEIGYKNITEAEKLYRGATDPLGSSRPNEKKKFYKNIVKDVLKKSDKYPEVKQLYEQMTGVN